MAKILINDLFEEFREENNRLLNELIISKKFIEFLEKYRKCLTNFNNDCNCKQNTNKSDLNDLEIEFKTLNESINREEELNRTLLITKRLTLLDTRCEEQEKESDNNIGNEENLSEEFRTNDVKRVAVGPKSAKKYFCDWIGCKLKYSHKYQLIGHINRCHTNDKPFKCFECNKGFSAKQHLNQHQKSHDSDKQFKCSYSDCQFKTRFKHCFKIHESRHEDKRKFNCFECIKWFPNEQRFKAHQQMFHNSDVKYSCKEIEGQKRYVCDWIGCGKSYLLTQMRELVSHYRQIHTNLKPFKCLECNKCFAVRRYLVTHQKISHIMIGKPFKCDQNGCEKCFKTMSELKGHKRYHSEERPYECEWPGCEARFKVNKDLVSHKQIHRNEQQFKCDFDGCVKSFKSKKDLCNHRRRHVCKDESRHKAYICSWPGCQFAHQSNSKLTEHMKRHQNIRPHKCTFDGCDKSFFSASNLNNHSKTHYNSVKLEPKFNCDLCIRKFVSKNVLMNHKLTAHGDDPNPFGCDWPECGEKFERNIDLKKHKLIHTNEQQFKCYFKGCSKTFLNTNGLNSHQKVHNKAFGCSWPGCESRFTIKSKLNEHLNKHLNIRPNKCEICEKSFFSKNQLNEHIKRYHKSF